MQIEYDQIQRIRVYRRFILISDSWSQICCTGTDPSWLQVNF